MEGEGGHALFESAGGDEVANAEEDGSAEGNDEYGDKWTGESVWTEEVGLFEG